jgi:hypothetical protein
VRGKEREREREREREMLLVEYSSWFFFWRLVSPFGLVLQPPQLGKDSSRNERTNERGIKSKNKLTSPFVEEGYTYTEGEGERERERAVAELDKWRMDG